jgi:hypothetical protein
MPTGMYDRRKLPEDIGSLKLWWPDVAVCVANHCQAIRHWQRLRAGSSPASG